MKAEDITHAILDMRARVANHDGLTPAQINQRWAHVFGVLVCERLQVDPGLHLFWLSEIDHKLWREFNRGAVVTNIAILKFGALYYDAETPEGVASLREIPAFKFRGDRDRYPGGIIPELRPPGRGL